MVVSVYYFKLQIQHFDFPSVSLSLHSGQAAQCDRGQHFDSAQCDRVQYIDSPSVSLSLQLVQAAQCDIVQGSNVKFVEIKG